MNTSRIDTLGGMTVPAPRAADPLGQLLDYAREHSIALAELRTGVAAIQLGHTDHEARLRVLEAAMQGLRGQLSVWRVLAGVFGGAAPSAVVSVIVH